MHYFHCTCIVISTQSDRLTLAHRQVTPLSLGPAGDRLDGLAAGEPEAGVALVGGGTAEGDVGGGDGEPVVDLGHGAAVDLLAAGDVRTGPLAA